MSKRKSSKDKEMEVRTGAKQSQKNSGQSVAKKRREINIDEANQLMLGMRANKESEREIMVEEGVRDKSDEDYDDDDGEEGDDDEKMDKLADNDKLGVIKTIPEQFRHRTKLEIVSWLVEHPDILRLANEINSSDVDTKNNEDKIRLWDESVKCLFLRVRNPSNKVLDDLIVKIFRIKIYNGEAKSYLERTRKFLTDFRNKFNQNILSFVEEYKEIRKSRCTNGNLSQKEIKEYIDESVVQKVLSRQLVAVNILELTNNGGLDTLVDFVREAFKVSWNGKNLPGIKDLDRMTKELSIPSRSGSKIVNSLPL